MNAALDTETSNANANANAGDGEISISRRIWQLAGENPTGVVFRHIGLDGSEPAFTWPMLDRRASQLAGALADRGLRYGDRLGLGLRNSPQFVFSALAAWKLGAVPVPVRWDVPDWELDKLRKVISPKIYLGPADLPWIDATDRAEVPNLPDIVSPHINGICSSGSTGTPKIIMPEKRGLYDPRYAGPIMQNWRPVSRPQTILVLAPMYHTNGFVTQFSMLSGDQLVVMEKFDAARVADVLERYRITTFTATPTMLQRIADLPDIDGRDLSSLDWILQGAAPMPPSLVHRWATLIGAERIVMAYGMTEALGLTAIRGDEWMTHQGSVGRGMGGTELRILGDDLRELPSGEVGQIYLRAPVTYGGGYRYLGDAPRLRGTEDGFQTAGDMGYLDPDGYLYLSDRRVDMIITGGANVFPAEVEAALIDHPAIADVVVIGLNDPEWGRRVHAVIEPADPANPPTTDDVIAYAKNRLAHYKAPKTVEFVAAIPRSEATKVNRGALVAARGG
ncbi:AMP-binding protein [Frankia sp. CNm7]|uniref:AMP-binding protein n=1 Tax=Frankia nepalensis TaxID=1836974 RepID=A0A937RIW4_9ACTN|nr:AMP-binding protein [Frankia nepalensis]MBL7494986.1 AMP-binding protein [Frankia nepalensis]MBL7514663.1 AMP-binding protein [Frankia nepalensis]MBL7521856.1 AMP-binding protein [Frankia nepalensis]MBL7633096.1 AMP-binding protein [Frankia nepalensis]